MAKHNGPSDYLKKSNSRQHSRDLSGGFKHNIRGNTYTTIQPQTKEYLKHKNITTITFEKIDTIKEIATKLREYLGNKNKYKIFDVTMIEYYNNAGIMLDTINRGDKGPYVEHLSKYKDILNTDEEKALLAMLIIDPELSYYHTYQNNPNDTLKILNQYYGFVSKELLEIERLYDFIMRYRDQGKDEEAIKYLANKIYNPNNNGPKR